MNKSLGKPLTRYAGLLSEIKTRIRNAQNRAAQAVNTELLRLYWDIGRLILARKDTEGWGTGVIPRLARDLHNELPEIKGFSERNIDYMLQFASEYPALFPILQPPVAKLPARGAEGPPPPPILAQHDTLTATDLISQPVVAKLPVPVGTPNLPLTLSTQDAASSSDSIGQPLVAQLPWAHNVLLIQKVKDRPTRFWYMRQALENGWSRNVLSAMVTSQAHLRQGKAITNFKEHLPPAQSDLAIQLLKDPYVFDFLTLQEPFHERELETGLLQHVQKFLLELGQGFAFVGRQFHVPVGDQDFYIDLLFYHLFLRCFVVIDLKAGAFKAEHAGKMNFYLSVVDDKLRHATDAPTIGLILCENRNRVIAEYALRDIKKPIGISQYNLTRKLPAQLQSSLPTIAQIEAELASIVTARRSAPKGFRKVGHRSRPKAKRAAGKRRR
jgi:predicted nuclease of restriction endonuclease-like (RecB) superfamily